jgi:hypothetical protein
MSQQRMAGDNQFQSEMKKAASGPGGQEHKTKPASLIGGGAWDTQVQRESQQFNNAAVSGSRGAENIAAYANVSKSATQGNGSFSIDNANKYVNNSRDQSNTNKAQNAGFSDKRVSNNVGFANKQRANNMAENEGFAMNTTNNFVNNAKNHREDNTAKAQNFANQTVDKYMAKNKANQSVNVEALDKQVRQTPIVDNAYSTVQGNNTFGDMYSYGRKELPSWSMPDPMKGVESPDFGGIYDKTKKDLDEYKV